jgi:hypothetical protein
MSAATAAFAVESESDEEEDEEVEIAAILAKKSTWHLHDIEKVKKLPLPPPHTLSYSPRTYYFGR